MITLSSSMISFSPMLLRRGLTKPCAMTWGESLVRNSAILAMPWLMMFCSSFPGSLRTQCRLSPKERAGVPGLSKLIAVVTLHVHGPAAQKAALNQSSHASCHMAELIDRGPR